MNTLIRKALTVVALCASVAVFTPTVRAQHGLLREIYPGVPTGAGIPGLLSNPNFPNNPASVTVISEFEAPDSFGDNYGQRIRGWIEAPATGQYIFWIASDDQGQLFLSSSDRPETRRLIAEVMNWTDPRTWTTEPRQQSIPITLEEGRRYYIEALMVEGTGGDHIAVRWQLPDGTIEEPIPNQRLYVELIPPQITQQPRNVTVAEGSPATFTVQLANRGAVAVQWLRNDLPIPGATNLTYTIPLASLADNGSRFRVSLTNEFATNAVLSAPAFLTVQRDVVQPTLIGAQTSGENGLLTIAFSEPVEVSSATSLANYSISGNVVAQGASVDPSGTTVILRTTPFTFGQSYSVLVNNVRDRALQPNVIEPDSQADFTFGFTPLSADVIYGKPESVGPSTRRTGLTISEIMYHPAPRSDGKNLKFIEIYNSEPSLVNIGGYKLAGDINYTFPEGTFLSQTNYAVVAAEPLDVQTLYGVPRVYGPFEDNLSDNGTLQLLNDQGAVLLEVNYDSEGDWPSAPDGAGPSMVLAKPSYGEGDPRAWDASQQVGGSPGRAESISANPYSGLVINEFLAHTDPPQVDFIEFYNFSSQEIDLSGIYITDDIATNKFRVPNGTRIPSLGFITFNEATLGFALSSGGERIVVRNPQRTRIIESIKFGPQANGISMGRFPDGNPRLRHLTQPTPGAANARALLPAVVINEIMYNPISGSEEDEYVELYNRSASPVNLNGWRLQDGISYTFTTDTILAPGGYLVLAKNIERLRTNYSGALNTANSLGNYNGMLSNSGERIALERPEISISTNGAQRVTNIFHIVVDEVKYRSGGRWPQWADGGGSSMELINSNADNDDPSNWADSDETQKSSWVTIERRGYLNHGSTNVSATNPSRNLHVLLTDAGEALLDNVQVLRDGGGNLLRNPGFERGLTDWLAGGTHDETTLETGGGRNGGNALHIRAAGRGDTAANRIRARLSEGLTNNTIATIRADVRWLRGTPEILLRLHGNYLELAGAMPVPKNLGTPGAANSRNRIEVGPAILAVEHRPILPVANQDVEVTGFVDDPERVAVVSLYYRVDPSTNFVRVPMLYRGAGYYGGLIPGQTNLTSVGFYIEASDASGSIARFPATAPENTGVILFGDGKPPGNLGVYRLWLTQTNINRWATRERSSNKSIDATFVYNNERIVYNMGTLYSGSPFHWNNYNGPLGNSANYLMVFPDDDRFLGQTDFVLNLPSNLGSDNTGVREQVFFWMADQVNQPFNYRRYHHLFLNGRNRGQSGATLRVFEDSQQPNRDFIEQWYPLDPDGDLHKIEDWFEYDDNFPVSGQGTRFNLDADLIALWTTNLTTGLPELKQERYRWWFRKRAVRDSNHDYSELFRLVQAANEPDEEKFVAQVNALVDVDEWLSVIALRHVAGDWDAFGYGRGKNMYAYKPTQGKWQLMHWDVAFAFGLGDGPQTDLFSTIESVTDRMLQTPTFRRVYYRALYEAANGPLISSRVNAMIDAKYNGLVQNGITVSSPDSVKQWIADRRQFVLAELANVSAGFSITSNGGSNYTTNRNTAILTGSAPVQVRTIRVNGQDFPIRWTSATTWELRYALKPQQNLIRLDGYDTNGRLIADASDSITINLTGQPEAIAGRVVINEIMYNPAVADSGFVEIHNTARNTAYDVSGYRLDGVDFVFPSGSVIPPGGFLVVVNNAQKFADVYGYTIPVVGEFLGSLQDGGEALSLVGFDATGTNEVVVSAVRYDDALPWSPTASGSDASLQLIDALQDGSRVGNWTAITGSSTPGATNIVRAILSPFPPLWVNEVQPANLNGRTDAAGDRDPWVELYNSGTTALSLNGFYLTDDFRTLERWPFPAGASIAPGQRIIVWLDGEANESTATEWHANFRLNATTGAIALVGPQRGFPTVFDYLAYNQIPAGQSFGAFPEGQAVWRDRFYQVTPGETNTLGTPPVQVFINEVMASNTRTIQDPDDLDFDDWIELYNAGSESVELGGYTMSDDLSDPTQFRIPAGTVIPARGFLLIWADNERSDDGQVHANFRLSADGESLGLFAPDGSEVDSITFGAQIADVSYGRATDGGSQLGVLATATPGTSNSGVGPNALQFTGVLVSEGQVTLNWNAKPGQTYRIEYMNSLTDPDWTLLRSVTAAGSAGVTTDTVTGRQRFYRLVE